VFDTLRRLDRTTANPDITLRGAEKLELQLAAAQAAMARFGDSSAKVTADTDDLSRGITRLGGDVGKLGNLAMPALVGSLVALSPQLITVGFGTAGFGAALIGTLKPLADAAGKTGGLRAHMDELDTAQQGAARSLLSLGGEFKDFQKALAPQVFGVFNAGLRIARHLMGDLLPVSRATGDALGQLLNRVDAEFQSGTWQQFFNWMATHAAADIRQLGDVIITLIHNLPQLLRALQPIGSTLLTLANDAAQVIGPLSKLIELSERSNKAQLDAAKSTDNWAEAWTNKWIPGARAVNDSISRDQELLRGWLGLSDDSGKSTRKLGDSVKNLAPKLDNMAASVQSVR
jgi:hypothetical protein